MLETTVQIDSFLEALKTTVMGSCIKQSKIANKYESLETQKAANLYITMIESGNLWSAYVTFDSDVLISAGIDKNLVNYYIADKERIPYSLRDKIMRLQKEKIVNNYEEKNDYYRMLAGLPTMKEVEEKDFVYCPPNEYDIPTDIPVHLLNSEDTNYLRGSEIILELIKKYPDKKYLKFLGPFAIPYHISRLANNYELLYAPPTKIESISNDYQTMYDKARNYFMIGIYNKEYANIYDYYDEFIGLSIITMAIQRTISNIFKQGIAREFYDTQLIQHLFKSYSIPYIEEMHIKYQRILAKNLNLLLTYKSTNKVLYDIAYMFEMFNINIYKYYLIKEHRLKTDGTPDFPMKEEIDEITGEPTGKMIPDYERMYSFHFQKINLKEEDKVSALTDVTNKINYITMTIDDPYWVNDSDLYNKLYEKNFNHIITKYMSLDAIFKIYEMMYECCHTIRMIIDKQEDFKRLEITSALISEEPVNLFDLVIFLCALGAKKFHLDGRIPLKGYQIANVYGFNFHTDLNKIRQDIMEHQDILAHDGYYEYIDGEVLKFMTSMNAVTIDDVSRLYDNIKGLKDFVVNHMYKTKDKNVYYAYRKLYRSLLVVEDLEKVYSKPNNMGYAKTYMELLTSLRPELATIVKRLNNEEELEEMINHIFFKLSELNENYKYLDAYNENDLLIKIILKLIRFFKSYTVDFTNSGIVYLFDDPYFCGLKVMEYMQGYDVTLTIEDRNGLYILYNDIITKLEALEKLKDDITLTEWDHMEIKIWINDYLHLLCKVSAAISVIVSSEVSPYDTFVDIKSTHGLNDKTIIKDLTAEDGRVNAFVDHYIELINHIIYDYKSDLYSDDYIGISYGDEAFAVPHFNEKQVMTTRHTLKKEYID